MKVLLVEDNPVTQEALSQLLRLRGHEVDVCGSGDGALVRLALHRPDVVVSDHLMPGGVDGLGLLLRIRSDPALSGIPVVLMTAAGDEVAGLLAEAARRLAEGLPGRGKQKLLHKPFRTDELLAAISELMAG